MKDNSVLVILKSTGNKSVIDQGDFDPEIHEYDYPLAYKGTDPSIESDPDDDVLEQLTNPET